MKRQLTEDHKLKIAEALRARRESETTKLCPKCRLDKPKQEFGRRKSGSLKSYCLPCDRIYSADRQRRYYASNPHLKEKSNKSSRESKLMSEYGITHNHYVEMLSRQQGLCAICRTSEPGGGRKYFAVDHDHATGAVRGLLCNNCNRGIGLLGDSAERIRNAFNYLQSFAPANDN